MVNKKIITCVALAAVIAAAGAATTRAVTAENNKGGEKNITVLSYKQTAPVSTMAFKADTYDKTVASGWLNDNEVLMLERREQQDKPEFWEYTYNCKVLDLNSGVKKEFNDQNLKINRIIDISPSKKYAICQGPRYIATDTNERLKQLQSGEATHFDIKVLNLENGEAFTLNDRYFNYEAKYKWISDNKIFVSYPSEEAAHFEWNIIDIKGNICDKGVLPTQGIRVSDLKEVDGKVEGRIYYGNPKIEEVPTNKDDMKSYILNMRDNCPIVSLDLKTKAVKQVLGNGFTDFTVCGDTIAAVCKVDGKNKLQIFDIDGNLKKQVDIKKGTCFDDFVNINSGDCMISPTENKIALVSGERAHGQTLEILNIQTGEIKKITSSSTIENIHWDDSGKNLSFDTMVRVGSAYRLDTQIVKFED